MRYSDRFLRKGEYHVSPTVATLDARAQFASLRRLLGSERPEIQEELDRLTEVLADTITEFDGLVPPKELAIRDAELRDLADRLDEETTLRERAEDRLGELLQAADDSPEELTSKHGQVCRVGKVQS